MHESAEPAQKKRGRGRPPRNATSASVEVPVESASSRTRGRISDPGQGLLTRRQAAQARGDNIPPTRSWKAAPRSPRKPSQKGPEGSGSVSAPPAAKPKSKGQVFDGVELVKRPESGKGKWRERVESEVGGVEEQGVSDEDAQGEDIDDAIEVETSSLENSNKGTFPLWSVSFYSFAEFPSSRERGHVI